MRWGGGVALTLSGMVDGLFEGAIPGVSDGFDLLGADPEGV